MSRRNRNKPQNQPQNVEPESKRIAITNVDQLKPVDMEVVITQGDYELVIPMRTLTFAESLQIDRDIPAPIPPSMGGPKGMIYDRQHPDYQRALEDTTAKRMLLRIARSLRIEGIGGETVDEEIDSVRQHIDNTIINGLAYVIRQMSVEHNARVEARANSFHRAGLGDTPNL